MSYRFRVGDEGALVLQVLEPGSGRNPYGYEDVPSRWRDATISDIPVSDPFGQPAPPQGAPFAEYAFDGHIVRPR